MQYLYHYTSLKNWDKIERYGILKPETQPYLTKTFILDFFKNGFKKRRFLVGIPEEAYKRWDEYGLLERIVKYTSGEVLLKVPLLNINRAFVLEHVHLSPKRLIEKFSYDITEKLPNPYHELGYLTIREDFIIDRATAIYHRSAIPLTKYCGQYVVPEIWVLQETPINLIQKIGE